MHAPKFSLVTLTARSSTSLTLAVPSLNVFLRDARICIFFSRNMIVSLTRPSNHRDSLHSPDMYLPDSCFQEGSHKYQKGMAERHKSLAVARNRALGLQSKGSDTAQTVRVSTYPKTWCELLQTSKPPECIREKGRKKRALKGTHSSLRGMDCSLMYTCAMSLSST